MKCNCKILLVAILAMFFFFHNEGAAENIKVHYLGHASFIIEFNDSINVLTDFGTPYCWGLESPIFGIGDFVPLIHTQSHYHDDHYNADRIPEGITYTLGEMDSLELSDFKITPVGFAENTPGYETSTAFIFEYKGFRICHLGDAQADIMAIADPDQQERMLEKLPGKIDILLMTIQGVHEFLPEAEMFIDLIQPRMVIPIHYWTPQYKEDWFTLLEEKNTTEDKNYEVIRSGCCEYEFDISDTNFISMKVIGLDPYPYYDPIPNPRNIAYNCPVKASSVFDVNHPAPRANDGYLETAWRSVPNNEEFYIIDLCSVVNVDTFIYHAQKQALVYDILTSTDSSTWDVAHSVDDGWDKVDTVSLGGVDCRYIKFHCKEPRIVNAEYFIYEFEVFESSGSTGIIKGDNGIKNEYLQCFPNPTSGYLTVNYRMSDSQNIRLGLMDSSGRMVKTIYNGYQNSGKYSKNVQLDRIPPGLYFLAMDMQSNKLIKKISIIK